MQVQTARIQVFSSFAAAEMYRPQWERWTQSDPQLSWNWMSHWWQQLIASDTPSRRQKLALTVVVGDGGECLAIAPWYVCRHVTGFALHFLGDGKAATDYLRILGEPRHESIVADTLAHWVTSAEFERQFGALDLIIADGHRSDENNLISWWNRLVQHGWRQHASPIESAWKTSLPGDWSQLLKQFSKSQRRKVNKAFRLRQEGTVSVRWVTDLAQAPTAWTDFVYLHQRRRNALGQAGCFDNAPFAGFLRATLQELMLDQRARLIFVDHQSQPIGTAMLLQTDDGVMMYQSGINPDHRHLEPGHLVNAFALEWANQQRLSCFDFMRGDEPYKQDWGAEPVGLLRTRLVAPRWSSRLWNSAWLATRGLKHLSQRWLHRPSVVEANHD